MEIERQNDERTTGEEMYVMNEVTDADVYEEICEITGSPRGHHMAAEWHRSEWRRTTGRRSGLHFDAAAAHVKAFSTGSAADRDAAIEASKRACLD